MQALAPVLSQLPLFVGLEPRHLALLAGCCSIARFEAGESLGRAGEVADRFWIVTDGELVLALDAPGREPLVVQTIGPDDVAGWSWLLPPHQLHFDVRALVATRALVFRGDCLRERFAEDPAFGYALTRRFLGVVVDRLEATSLQLSDAHGDRV